MGTKAQALNAILVSELARTKKSEPVEPTRAQVADRTYELVPTADLTPHPSNPRNGDVGAISESIGANGFYGAMFTALHHYPYTRYSPR